MTLIHLQLDPDARPFPYPVLGLGNFDGVHIGHQSILKRVVDRAGEKGGTSMALTFDPHPVKVLFPERSLQLLCTTREKIDLIGRCGIAHTYCLEFTREFSMLSPREFVQEFLVQRMKVREVFVGQNYGFGRRREGNVALLETFGKEFGFHVEIVPPVILKDHLVSSSLVREALKVGEIERVALLLGRPYDIDGNVVEGEGRGKALGYPTANLLPGEKLIPGNGVYAVRVERSGETWPGIVYIGTQPTFQNAIRQIEIHLFDYQGNLYGEALRVRFYGRVRGEMKFSDSAELVTRIGKDIQIAKKILEQT